MLDLTLMQSLVPDGNIRVFDETASTNRDARDWLLSDANHGDLVLATRQTGGRGRLGRSFASPEGGLYMSLILKTSAAPGEVTTLCAVAVRRAILQLTGIETDIKWVNDLLLDGKKVCGILCENVFSGSQSQGMIAGIGINIYGDHLPDELRPIARSLYPTSTSSPISLEHLSALIRREILSGLDCIPAHMAAYRRHCITLGQNVYWTENNQMRTGKLFGNRAERRRRVKKRITFHEVKARRRPFYRRQATHPKICHRAVFALLFGGKKWQKEFYTIGKVLAMT